jgi:RHS repeat-associated protein
MSSGGGRTFEWDIDNRVTSVTMGGTTTMEYDYTGMRVKKNGAGTTLYPFQGVEIDSTTGVMTKFIRIGTENFASHKGTGDERYYYHNDHLGGVNVITDKTGGRAQLLEYDPWGSVSRNESTITADPTHRFTGKELDPETGLYYYGGRYYDPEISRFISADAFVPEAGNPQSLNRYSYTLNNPVRYIDPSGHFYMSKTGGGSFLFGPLIIASLVTGFLTGGATFALTGNLIAAGIVGGMSAGMVGASITGGSIWKGALLGGLAGAIGGPTFSALGGNPALGFAASNFLPAVGAGAITGAVVGAVSTGISGGNFGQNVGFGALGGAGMAAATWAVGAVWERVPIWQGRDH